ncbi:hypothetical protein AV656_11400 [Bhargavaea cecembensis]|uniref:Uncharacterized protein n=1 Tax=Bhargavaea cecembensis TaxID=394098 RepID=A0A165GPE3_9BACL|nr:hypothetical protein [Bhargavaea cecembensis]KZE37179.1 hypothetical protein AV656_11400 [Bhargavaea cecembensis]
MRKYLGILSIAILVVTFIILQSLVGKDIGASWVFIILIGYSAAVLASWYSERGFWRKVSAAILIVLPAGYLIILAMFMLGMNGF